MFPELDQAYRKTTYHVEFAHGIIDLRIGIESPALRGILTSSSVQTWAIITPCNPASTRLPDAENQSRLEHFYRALAAATRLYSPSVAIADDNCWPPEVGAFVFDIDRHEADLLAREFGQLAYLFGNAEGAAELIWLT